jgi:glucokinase
MRSEVTVGIDIGGTNTVLGFVDGQGTCMAESSIPTLAHEDAESLVARLTVKIREMYAPLSDACVILGIGIGAPNANYYRGTVENPPNLSWKGVTPLAAFFTERFDIPVVVTNDANAAALGEMRFGAARGMRDFIVITLGTGLGSGIVANGELVYGADGFAGEIGHSIVDPQGRWCGCGKRGCLETYASATGICRTVFELLCNMRDESELRDVSYRELTAKRVTEAARKGDAIALAAFDYTGRILGMKLADSVAHTSPEAIILFGGLAHAGDLLFAPTRRSMEEHLLGIFKGKVKLLPSSLPAGNTAVLGAAALSWTEWLRPSRGSAAGS